MKALTLYQPWATLIALGVKRIETRSWSTSYRGPLAIHAGMHFPVANRRLVLQEPFRTILGPTMSRSCLPSGKIVAVADLVEVVRIGEYHRVIDTQPVADGGPGVKFAVPPPEESPERACGDYTPGRWAWLLANVRRLVEPIPAQGARGLWDWVVPGELVFAPPEAVSIHALPEGSDRNGCLNVHYRNQIFLSHSTH
jgi:hypothetical protein